MSPELLVAIIGAIFGLVSGMGLATGLYHVGALIIERNNFVNGQSREPSTMTFLYRIGGSAMGFSIAFLGFNAVLSIL